MTGFFQSRPDFLVFPLYFPPRKISGRLVRRLETPSNIVPGPRGLTGTEHPAARCSCGDGTISRPGHPPGRPGPPGPPRPLIIGKGEIRPARPAWPARPASPANKRERRNPACPARSKIGPISVSSRRNAKFGEPAVGGTLPEQKKCPKPPKFDHFCRGRGGPIFFRNFASGGH